MDEITLSSLSPEEVFIVDHTEVCPTLPRKYYKLMIPDIDITLCDQCGHFFLRDEYDFAYLEHGGCPVCHSKEPNTEDS